MTQVDWEGATVLLAAAESGSAAQVRLLINEFRVDVHLTKINGTTTLVMCTEKGNVEKVNSLRFACTS